MKEPVVILQDVRACKLCFPGGRKWAAANGIVWSDFIVNGVTFSKMESLNDAYANRLLAAARRRLGIVE